MPSDRHYRVNRGERRRLSPFFITLVIAAVFSAGIAAVWQMQTPAVALPQEPYIDPSLLAGPIVSAQSVPTVPVLNPDSTALAVPPPASGSGEATASSSPGEAAEVVPAVAPGDQVPQTPRASSSYFDDAAFIGDSITTGIKIYDIMSNADVFAGTGLGLTNLLTQPVVKWEGETITVLDALSRSNPKKIYLMVGANSLGGEVDDWMFDVYGQIIDSIKAQHPDSILYVQSVLPLYEPTFRLKYSNAITNQQIDGFNERLKGLVKEKGVYYLDVASVFKDASGAMPSEYTPDGMHINSAQYIQWFDYLKLHAIGQAAAS
ncbi:MAG: GDSL-type esterase/lipase family protein [Oscillospiraceae bacterium]